jgi:hypothetical protein
MLQTSLAYGLSPSLQLRGDLSLTPSFTEGPYPNEWRHGSVGLGVVYASGPNFRFRVSYSYELDDSGAHSFYGNWASTERHTLSIGFSALW